MTEHNQTDQALAALAWSDHFARQISDDDIGRPARVSAVHRSMVETLSATGSEKLALPEAAGSYAVGDWVLAHQGAVTRRLDRRTELSRRAAGEVTYQQLIAANVDTLGIVTSCNADFNIARLERYLALAEQGGCLPLIILTKPDLTDDLSDYLSRARHMSPLAEVIAVNAKDSDDVTRLHPWCGERQTLALVGSSGVGKTTLQNHLTGVLAATAGIREDDAKGRHTTTSRNLRATVNGGWLIDTPGMRELRLADASEGIETVFNDIVDLTLSCKFSDCGHDGEPGCAVQAALADGSLSQERLDRWRKLEEEDRRNSETLNQKRGRERSRQKMYNEGKARGKRKRGR